MGTGFASLLKPTMKVKVKVKSLSPARLFVTPWIVACTKLLHPWDFQGKKYWSGLPFPSPGNLPNPEIEPGSPALQADSLPSDAQGKPGMDFVIVNDAAATGKSL